MNFLFLFRGGYKKMSDFSIFEQQSHIHEWNQWIKQLQKNKHLKFAAPLTPFGHVVSKKFSHKMNIGEDSIGGFLYIEAKDINEAVQLSKKAPIFSTKGSVEVREIAHTISSNT